MTGFEEGYEPIKRHHKTENMYLDEWLHFPAHIHHMSYRMDNPPEDRPQSQRTFLALAKTLRIRESNMIVSKKFAYGISEENGGDRLVVIWEAHTEYYNLQIWHIPGNKKNAACAWPDCVS